MIQIFFLPLFTALKSWKGGLLGIKSRGMKLTATFDRRNGLLLVQHFVEDDPLDKVARHELAIERGMNPDELVYKAI